MRVTLKPAGRSAAGGRGAGLGAAGISVGWSSARANCEIALAALLGLSHRLAHRAARRDDALEKAGRDSRLAAPLLRPAQDRLARSERRDEVMRGLADAPLRRREPERGAHRPVEKGVGLDRGRPDFLVEARQKGAIEAEEARFEQAEDLEARVAAARRRSADRGERIVEQNGVFAQRAGKGVGRRLGPFLHELGQRLEAAASSSATSKPATAEETASRCRARQSRKDAVGKRAQRGERARDVARKRLGRLPAGLADAADRRMRMRVLRRLGAPPRRPDRDRRGGQAGWRERWRARGRAPRLRRRRARGRSAPRDERGGQETSAARTRSRLQGSAWRARPRGFAPACARPNPRPRRPIAQAPRIRGARWSDRA